MTGSGHAVVAVYSGGASTIVFNADFQQGISFSGDQTLGGTGAVVLTAGDSAYTGTLSGFGVGDTIVENALSFKASYHTELDTVASPAGPVQTLSIVDGDTGNAVASLQHRRVVLSREFRADAGSDKGRNGHILYRAGPAGTLRAGAGAHLGQRGQGRQHHQCADADAYRHRSGRRRGYPVRERRPALSGPGSVGGDGSWSITANTALVQPGTDGQVSLTATELDIVRDVSAASAPLLLSIQTAPPPAPSGLTLAAGSDTGFQGDNITDVTTPTVTGTTQAGSTVTLFDTTVDVTVVVGTATSLSDGSWSIRTSTLPPGLHTLTATETDFVGNTSGDSAPLALRIVDFAALVTQLYQDILGRDPDAGGLAFWTNALATGTSLHDARTAFANSGEAQAALAGIYLRELGRAPDPAGILFCTNALIAGTSTLNTLRSDFASSAESQANLAGIYQRELGRAPDPAGIAFCTNALITGTSLDDLRGAFASSAESQANLAGIYLRELGRAPDPVGIAFCTNALATGTSIDDLRGAFASSAESQANLAGIYQRELGRAPDPAGILFCTNALTTGTSIDDLRGAFASSDESQANLAGIYQRELGRAPDPVGIAFCINALATGTSIDDLRGAFASSAESQANIAAIFTRELGRDASSGDIAFCINALTTGTSIDDLRGLFGHSAEAQAALTAIFQGVVGAPPTRPSWPAWKACWRRRTGPRWRMCKPP